MGLTHDQIYDKLKGLIPSWFFEEEALNDAYFHGIASTLLQTQSDAEALLGQTFIDEATGEILDMHGEERSKTRLPGENDTLYQSRIRNLSNSCTKPDLLALVRSLIITGNASIREDFNDTVYASRGYYASREAIVCDRIENTFSVIIDKQVHAPYSFASRAHFASRETYAGSHESLLAVLQAIVQAVNDNKALGTLYRLVET